MDRISLIFRPVLVVATAVAISAAAEAQIGGPAPPSQRQAYGQPALTAEGGVISDAAIASDPQSAPAPPPEGTLPGGTQPAVEASPQPRLADDPSGSPVLGNLVPRILEPRKAPPSPYKPLFYDNDFRYLEDPRNTECYFGDLWKRLPVGQMMLDLGGEYRLRQHNEHILLRDNDFLLQRTRLYANFQARPWLRLYGEAIDATSSYEDLPPRAIEENRFDALNLFGDVRVWDGPCTQIWFRGGRQELLYGNQRLISPLDWANTRRTFDGFKMFARGEKWNIDAFWVRPVPAGQHLGNDHNWDHPDTSQEFLGVYLTRKGLENQTVDLYYLRLAEYDGRPDFDYHTLGARWDGKYENWLAEAEAGYQLGEFGLQDHSAGFFTVGGGRKLVRLPWNMVFWTYYDWASGNDPTARTHGTFNQLFAFGHKYLGFMDLVGRQNIEDWNFQLTVAPWKPVELLLWWHIFHLDQAQDALYDAGGAIVRQDPTGAAGTDVGQELDVVFRWTITPRAEVLFGYSHLFPGDFLLNTPGGAPGKDFYYTQFTARF